MSDNEDTNLFYEDKIDKIISKLDSIEAKIDKSKYWFVEYLIVWLLIWVILKFFNF